MKGLYLFGIITSATIIIGSCAKDGVAQNKTSAIEFNTYIGRDAQTKATSSGEEESVGSNYTFGGIEMTLGELQKTGFGVSAVYTGQDKWEVWDKTATEVSPNFMFKQKVYYDGGWKYEPVKYWPTMQNDKISFFAYAPFATDNNIYGFGRSDVWTAQHYSLKFAIQDKPENMVDFVAAAEMDKSWNEGQNNNVVTFNFSHALTRLLFSAKTSEVMESNSHVVITGARLVKGPYYYKKGIYYFTQKRNTAGSNDSYWGPTKGQDDKKLSDYDLSGILASSTGEVAGKAYDKAVIDLTTATSKPLFKKKGDGENAPQQYLFLIPTSGSEANPGIPANSAAVAFDYDIVTEDSSLAAGYSCTSATKIVYLPAGIMQKGKAYNITFTFNVDKIEVAAEVTGWGDADEDGNINVPFTPDDVTTVI